MTQTSHRLQPAPLSTFSARRICVIKPSSLGDIVQSLPILAVLRHRFPRARISWIANKPYVSFLSAIPQIDEVIPFDRELLKRSRWAVWKPIVQFGRDLARRRFDLAIDLQGLLRSGLMCWMTGAPKRLGLTSAREGSSFFYTDLADDLPRDQLAVDRYWKVAELFGVGHLEKEFPLGLTSEERAWAREAVSGLQRPLLGINAGARWVTKRWPASSFAESANRALGGRPGNAVLLGGPGEEEMATEVQNKLTMPSRNFCGKLTLRQLAALLEQCDRVLTNDSGPMHLAAALGVPTVSLFTCTIPERAGAFGEGHRVAQTEVGCRGSYVKECDRLDCMKDLTVDKLLPILNASLAECDSHSADKRRAA